MVESTGDFPSKMKEKGLSDEEILKLQGTAALENCNKFIVLQSTFINLFRILCLAMSSKGLDGLLFVASFAIRQSLEVTLGSMFKTFQ